LERTADCFVSLQWVHHSRCDLCSWLCSYECGLQEF